MNIAGPHEVQWFRSKNNDAANTTTPSSPINASSTKSIVSGSTTPDRRGNLKFTDNIFSSGYSDYLLNVLHFITRSLWVGLTKGKRVDTEVWMFSPMQSVDFGTMGRAISESLIYSYLIPMQHQTTISV